jgi:hypothetical protein
MFSKIFIRRTFTLVESGNFYPFYEYTFPLWFLKLILFYLKTIHGHCRKSESAESKKEKNENNHNVVSNIYFGL